MVAPPLKLFIFTAPSGAGKTTIVRHLLAKYPQKLAFSVSATTRPPRPHEQHGADYYFLTLEAWKQKIENQAFIEWEEVYENQFYGTLRSEIFRLWDLGKHVLFDIDVRGAMNIKQQFPDAAVTVFVQPPSPQVLFDRLRRRNTEDEASFAKRIQRATFELTYADKCDLRLINDDLASALAQSERIVEKFF